MRVVVGSRHSNRKGTTIKAPKVVMNKGRSKKKLANFNSTNGCYHMIDEVLA